MERSEEKPDILTALRSLLKETRNRHGGLVFIDGNGNFVNARGQYINPYDVLVQLEHLRVCVSRCCDYADILPTQEESHGHNP